MLSYRQPTGAITPAPNTHMTSDEDSGLSSSEQHFIVYLRGATSSKEVLKKNVQHDRELFKNNWRQISLMTIVMSILKAVMISG
ncbi:hypothetical protein C9I92_16850 [Photobacterium ganghwense]|uniref:Uncharacterized protein n=1 Tax=Photobacterium ganghwense TaxID=320778 RepID=A0A0J1K1D9_9GAMM|nr:hypothetical protein ABT57_15815 [Photobacterium ganghwense]PSU07389.1 hypothetical protein C9I92_16850 [Photobacterium ganghwense]